MTAQLEVGAVVADAHHIGEWPPPSPSRLAPKPVHKEGT